MDFENNDSINLREASIDKIASNILDVLVDEKP